MLEGARDGDHLTILLADADRLTGLDDVGRNVEDLAVDDDVLVGNELTGRRARRSDAEAIDDVVETRFAHLEEEVARLALLGHSALEEDTELTLAHTVDVLGLLLLEKLLAVLGDFALTLRAVLSRRIGALDFLLAAENRLAEATGNLGLGTCIT